MPALESPPTMSSGVDSSSTCQTLTSELGYCTGSHSTAFLGASTPRQVPLSLLVLSALQLTPHPWWEVMGFLWSLGVSREEIPSPPRKPSRE